MFTGIVKGILTIDEIEKKQNMVSLGIRFPPDYRTNLQIGASVAVDGVCLTVSKMEGDLIWFDVIKESLARSTLKYLDKGSKVNIERAAVFGDEIGGHVVSGHIFGVGEIAKVDTSYENNKIITIKIDPSWIKYFFPKGFIALDGLSLTLVDVKPEGYFSVHLIPETLRSTKFGFKQVGDKVNIEIEVHMQAIVDTVDARVKEVLKEIKNRDS